jgi:hypothetical protein
VADGHTDPSVIRQWVEYHARREPELVAWDLMRYLEKNGYDIWCIVPVEQRSRMTPESMFAPHSPEHIIDRWMGVARAKRSQR